MRTIKNKLNFRLLLYPVLNWFMIVVILLVDTLYGTLNVTKNAVYS